jgi:predicted O-methyltransferase YrrM
MGVLDQIGLKYDADKSSRFHNYLDFYEKQLPGRDFAGRLLEIGVMDGLSMKMWREYYPNAEIVGIDIKDMSYMHNTDWQVPESVKLIQCDGTDPKQTKKLGKFDIIIDDGSHYWSDQQTSFEILYKELNKGGIYILEDLWTSYIDYYADAKLNTMDYLKKLEKKGMKMTFFRHKHDRIKTVFPKQKGLAELGSITVAIKAGQQ